MQHEPRAAHALPRAREIPQIEHTMRQAELPREALDGPAISAGEDRLEPALPRAPREQLPGEGI